MSEVLTCIQCGRENCNGHKCENCGKNAEAPLMVGELFYCDKFCLSVKHPNHPLLAGVKQEVIDAFTRRADIIGRMRALKKEAEDAGVAWIK